MDFNDFKNIVLGFLSEEQFKESSSALENLIDSNYQLYIKLLLAAIQEIENERVFNASITLLQVEVLKKRIFFSSKLITETIETLTPLFSKILQSQNVQDNFKKIMAFVLAQLHIFVYHNSNNLGIPNYILKIFDEIPEIRKYLTYFIFEVSINDEDLGGFNIEDLIKILTNSTKDKSIYIPCVNLFFAIATRRPDVQVLQEIFPDLISSCPKSNLDEMLLSLSDYSEHSSSFLYPHLGPLVQRLCDLAIDTEMSDSIRDKAMICLTSIGNGAPEMCQNTEEYYIPVFKTLIQIVSEINDESPWEYDVNNTYPYQIALDSISNLFEKYDNSKIFIPIYEMIMQILSEEEIPWQVAYACISTLSCINILIMWSIGEDKKFFLFEKVSTFMKIECHPRVRIAVYSFIYKLSLNGVIYPIQEDLSSILIDPLESLIIIENNSIAKKLAYEAYIEFISILTSRKVTHYFTRFFPSVIKELTKSSDEFVIYIVRLIGPLFKSAREDSIVYLPTILSIINELIKNKDHNVQAESIHCFALSIAYMPNNDTINKYCNCLAEVAFPLLHSNKLNDDTLDRLYNATHKILVRLGRSVTPFAHRYIQMILEDCQKEITIEETNSFEMNETFKNKSIYLRISHLDSPIKQYVLNNEVKRVKNALLILESFIKSDPNFRGYLDGIYLIIKKWLTSEFSIEPIQTKCWSILRSISFIFDSTFQFFKTEFEIGIRIKNIEFILDCYIDNIKQINEPLFIQKIVGVVNVALLSACSLKWENIGLFESVLKTFPFLVNEILEMKENKFKNMEEFDAVDLYDSFISHIDSCLCVIAETISTCFILQPEITTDFYSNSFGLKIDEYLSNEHSKIFGMKISTSFIINNKDMDKMLEFCEFLIENAVSFDNKDDLALDSFYCLGKLFYNLPLRNKEEADHFMSFFTNFFQMDQLQQDNDCITIISDYANIAFAKFLIVNKFYFNPYDSANAFIDAMPLWEAPQDSDMYFHCMADMLDLGWFNIACGDEWPEFLLGSILTGTRKNQFNDETRLRLARILRKLYNTPEGKCSIDKTLNESFDQVKVNMFWSFIQNV